MAVKDKPKRKRGRRTKNAAQAKEAPQKEKKEEVKDGLKIRRFTKNDTEAVNALVEQWGFPPFLDPANMGLALIAQNGDGIVGLLEAKSTQGGTYVLENFFVQPEKTWAGRGIKPNRVGIKLYREMISRLAQKNPKRIVAIVDVRNAHLARVVYKLFGKESYLGLSHLFVAGG